MTFHGVSLPFRGSIFWFSVFLIRLEKVWTAPITINVAIFIFNSAILMNMNCVFGSCFWNEWFDHPRTFEYRPVSFYVDRPLSPPFWPPTHFWVSSSFILCGPSTFTPFLTTHALLSTVQFYSLWTVHFRVLDRPLYVLSDRPLWPRTVHFWGFGPSTFTQLDRPLSLRTVHFHLDPKILMASILTIMARDVAQKFKKVFKYGIWSAFTITLIWYNMNHILYDLR